MATLHVQTSFFPLAFILFGVTPSVQINGVVHKRPWGWSSFELPPGTYTLEVSFPYMGPTTGKATTEVTVSSADEVLTYMYGAPMMMFSAGTIRQAQNAPPPALGEVVRGDVQKQYSPEEAPNGIHPRTGLPSSSRSKVLAALLQIFLGAFGAGRFYTGHTKLALIQIVVNIFTCGGGLVWPLVDGMLMILGEPLDAEGRPLK